jgi:DNA-binding transcriptional ArsR family regulator
MAMSLSIQLRALAHPSRLALLGWLKDPTAHFPPQVDGDLIKDGVCAIFIAKKWDVAQPTASRHLKLLVDADLVIATRKKGWIFYRRNEAAYKTLKSQLEINV